MSKEISDNNIDTEIIQAIEVGDNLVINKLYDLYYPPIARMIISHQGSYDEAQDIFQETVMVLYDKVINSNFKLTSKLGTFLYAVAKRLWLKQLTRGEAKYKTDSIADHLDNLVAEDAIEEHIAMEAQLLHMEEAMIALGEPCKSILSDFYLENKSMAEICEKFGYTNADNAKNQKYKCLQRLKKLFFKK